MAHQLMDQCKDSGWMSFNFPRSFENQGDCVSNVNTGKELILILNLHEGEALRKAKGFPSSV